MKIYSGTAESDRLLSAVVTPLIAEGRARKVIDRWFYIRYGDPEHHIRLRLKGNPTAVHGDLLAQLSRALEAWVRQGSISRIQLDTYRPEFERYGGRLGLEISERIFEVDSDAALSVASHLDGDAGADVRWQVALRGLDTLIDDFGLEARQKLDFVLRRRREYGHELGVGAAQLKQLLGDKFRHSRRLVEELWKSDDGPAGQAIRVWGERSERLKPLVAQLRDAEREGLLAVPVTTLLDSYVHMSINRLVRAHGKTHELVMFDFLARHLESLEARTRAASRRGVSPSAATSP